MKEMIINFKLNGVLQHLSVRSDDLLLDVLRDRVGIKSPKTGCDRGGCGACTVFLNGKTVRSCIVLAVEADGGEIVTLESLSEKPTCLQKSFARHNSFQCGFCAPGVILSVTELLDKNPHPDRKEIKEAIAGNLCRCTGYTPIIEAVEDMTKKNI